MQLSAAQRMLESPVSPSEKMREFLDSNFLNILFDLLERVQIFVLWNEISLIAKFSNMRCDYILEKNLVCHAAVTWILNMCIPDRMPSEVCVSQV